MNIGVLGTGMVGDAIASKLVALGHEVIMGSREATSPKAAAWARRAGANARIGTFADAAAFGELIFNCTRGASSLEALHAAGAKHLAGKVLVDVANILPPDKAEPVSLGEKIQDAFPETKVVKTLSTINSDLMVDPSKLPGSHTLFVSGNDAAAKETVRGLLASFGWKDVFDLGDIATARAVEAYLRLWLAVWQKVGTPLFNINVVR